MSDNLMGVNPGLVAGTGEGIPSPDNSASPASRPEQTDSNGNLKEFAPDGKTESYLELERKMTQMGQENSELKKFYEDVMPTLEVIQNDPNLLDGVMKKMFPGQYASRDTAQPATPSVQGNDVPSLDMKAMREQILREVEEKNKGFKAQIDYEKNVESYIERNDIDNEMLAKIKRVVDDKGIDDIEVAHKFVLASELASGHRVSPGVQQERKTDATSVGGSSTGSQGEAPRGLGFDDLIKSASNPNKL